MKPHNFFGLTALLLLLVCLPVHAAKFEVATKGKTMEIAESNARLIAVRKCMQALIDAEVIRANMEAVRQRIILQSPQFVRGLEAKNSFEQNAFLTLEAVVDVDVQALTDVIASLKMDEAARARMNTAAASLEARTATDSGTQTEPRPAAAEAPPATPSTTADPAAATDPPAQTPAAELSDKPAAQPTTPAEPVAPDTAPTESADVAAPEGQPTTTPEVAAPVSPVEVPEAADAAAGESCSTLPAPLHEKVDQPTPSL